MSGSDAHNPEFDVITLDPGHGGEDVGAIGATGSYEKTITLAVTKKIQRLLARLLPKTKVMLTRTGDVYVPLPQRTEFANNSHGKLFVSIHCNAAKEKPHPANGCEVFLLRPGKTKEAIALADRENSYTPRNATGIKKSRFNEEDVILAAMAQQSFVQLSEQFAGMTLKQWKKNSSIAVRGINQSGFYVLAGASMPNALIEIGFLTNEEEERALVSEKGQNDIAKAIADAIAEYAKYYRNIAKEKP